MSYQKKIKDSPITSASDLPTSEMSCDYTTKGLDTFLPDFICWIANWEVKNSALRK